MVSSANVRTVAGPCWILYIPAMLISCPQCGKLLDAPTPLPELAQCPFCNAVFKPTPDRVATHVPLLVPNTASEIVRGPATGLLIAALASMAWSLCDLVACVALLSDPQLLQDAAFAMRHITDLNADMVRSNLYWDVPRVISCTFIIFGSFHMRRLKSYAVSMASSVLSVVPCMTCCFCVGIPFGIWAIVVLSRADVRASFES